MESMVGLAMVLGALFLMFQFRGAVKKEAKAMEAEASANYMKRHVRALKKANQIYKQIEGKEYLTLEEIEARLDGEVR